MAVKICGPVLASLFFDQSICGNDQEGLLLGNIVSHKTDSISDSQISSVKEEISLHVYGHVPCGSAYSWYDNAGKVDSNAMKQFLKQHSKKEIIGWYKFRRNSSYTLSLRERAVHKRLKETLPGLAENHFIFLLCGMQSSSNGSTHSLDHLFFIQNERKFNSVASEVINLKDTSHNEYKMQPSVTINTQSGAFSSALSEVSGAVSVDRSGAGSSDLNVVTSTVEKQLQNLCEEVNSTEVELGALRNEIKQIKDKIKLKEDHLKSAYVPLSIPPKAAVSTPVPKISLGLSTDSPTSASRGKRLSSGSSGASPSMRKILDFEHQPSQFDIIRGNKNDNETGDKMNENTNMEIDDNKDDKNLISGPPKTNVETEDLICLDDDDDGDDDLMKIKPISSASLSNPFVKSSSGSGGGGGVGIVPPLIPVTNKSKTRVVPSTDNYDIDMSIPVPNACAHFSPDSSMGSPSLLAPVIDTPYSSSSSSSNNPFLDTTKRQAVGSDLAASDVLVPQKLFSGKTSSPHTVKSIPDTYAAHNTNKSSESGSDSSSAKNDGFSDLVTVLKETKFKNNKNKKTDGLKVKKAVGVDTSASSSAKGGVFSDDKDISSTTADASVEDDCLLSDDEVSASPEF